VKSLPVFVSFVVLVSLVFAVDARAQTPAQGPIQMAQAAGGASQGALPATSSGVTSTLAAVVAVGVAAAAAVATSNTTTASNH
jgi:hypothetical protein